MFKSNFLKLFILILPLEFYAQTEFRGVLKSEKDQDAVPFAHIRSHSDYGSISNSKGQFIFSNDEKLDSLKINISAIGYRDKSIYIYPNLHNKISLKKERVKLNEVIVKYEDPIKALIKKIVEKIPENYPLRFEQLYGEINENVYWDSLQTKPVYKANVLTRSDKFSYSRISELGNVEILDKKIKYFDFDSLKVRFYAGTHKIHSNDFVKLRKDILKVKNLNKFEVKINDTLFYKEFEVITLTYKNHKVKGKLFIDSKSYALVRVERYIDPKTIRSPLNVLRKYQRLYYTEVIDYFKGEDDKWRLNFSHYTTGFKNKASKESIYLDNTYFLYESKKGEKVIPENDRILYNDVLTNTINSDSISKQNNKDQLFKFLNRFRFSYEIMLFPIKVNLHTIDQYKFGIEKVINKENKNLYAFQIRYDYKIKNNFGLAFKAATSFHKNEFENFSLGVWKEKEINLNGSWKFQLSIFLDLQRLRINHGVVKHKEAINYSNRIFDSGIFEYYSQQQNIGFTPSINFSRRIGNKFSLGIVGSYFFPFLKRQGILIKEKNEFWFWNKSSIFIDNIFDTSSIDTSFLIGLNFSFKF